MPRYAYKCKKCEHVFEKVHSMSEKLKDCPTCEAKDQLVRIPSNTIKSVSRKEKVKVGEVVKKSIEDIKIEVKDEKERLRKEEHKP